MYASNTYYTNILRADDPKVVMAGVIIDEKKETWEGPGDELLSRPTVRRIGECRYPPWGSQGGVIGVYDRMNDIHLDLMVSHGREAVKPPSSVV